MPKRRATRRALVRKPKAPEGDEGHDLSQEEKMLKLQTYLNDFDSEGIVSLIFFLYESDRMFKPKHSS
jgi:hypothetical protein